MPERQEITKLCLRCGKAFVAFGRSPQFCSDACAKARKTAWRKVALAVALVVGVTGPATAQSLFGGGYSSLGSDGMVFDDYQAYRAHQKTREQMDDLERRMDQQRRDRELQETFDSIERSRLDRSNDVFTPNWTR